MKKKWFPSYDKNVPWQIDIPSVSIHQLLLNSAALYPQQIAIIEGDKQMTYEVLANQAVNFAKGLRQLGINPGMRVGLVLPNQINFLLAYFGSLAVGCIVVSINPAYTSNELDKILSDSEIEVVVCQRENAFVIEDLQYIKRRNTRLIISDDHESKPTRHIYFSSVIELGRTDESELPLVSPNCPAIYQYTGGTTGIPKAAVALHKNIVANVFQFRSWLTVLITGKEVFLAVLPLFHVYGMVLAMCLGIHIGATLVIPPAPIRVEQLISLANDKRVTFAPLAPSIIHAMAVLMEEQGLSIPSLLTCISGSAALMNADKAQFKKHIGGIILEGYGLSEAPTATHCNPFIKQKNGSIGLPLPNVNCRIKRNLKSLFHQNPEQCGELLIKGPQVMKKYHRDRLRTWTTLRGGWLHTGDYVHMDAEGYFYIDGRKKEMFKVSGFQVWPKEIENVIQIIQEVKEVAVAGIKDEITGETAIAWVVVKEGKELRSDQILNVCKKNLSRYKIPSKIFFISKLPRNAIGKILKRALIQKYFPYDK